MNQAEDRAHRIGQKNSVNIYYLHGRQTLDDLIFDLLNYKSLVTTDITDGRKVSLGMCKTDMQKIELEEVAKDGTIIDPKVQDKQSRLHDFFALKNEENFVKRKKSKAKIAHTEEIEESSSEEESRPKLEKPITLSDRKREVS